MATRRVYFSPGLSLHRVCAGDEVRLLRAAEEAFDVRLVCRENLIDLVGEPPAIERGEKFFTALDRLYTLHGSTLEPRDFELLLRSCREHHQPDVDALWHGRVTVSPKRREVLPRSRRQLEYLTTMRRCDVTFGIGPAGTGKTFLAMAMAVSELLRGSVTRIVLTRPARESGERLGFLPGSLEDKVSPYLRPLYDALYEMLSVEEAQELIARNVIEVAPLAFMRGRTLSGSFIILDEAQNTTVDQMLMFLTRMGFGSRCVVTGDPSQSDLARDERSGLQQAIERLRRLEEIGFVFFDTSDVVRHSLLEKIITAYAVPEDKA